jgi:hypothetical protein
MLSAIWRHSQNGVRAVGKKLGPLEVATLLIAVGTYLVVGALWPPGAAGSAFLVSGAIALGIALLRALPPRPPREPKA